MLRRFWFLLVPLVTFAAGRSVLDGVYSDAQAARGEAEYSAKCARCHEGADVDGPPLTGDPFVDRWREDSLESLHKFVSRNMPRDEPGKLAPALYVDLVAFLLQHNSYPAGSKELTAGDLGAIQLVGHDGPKPLPTNATVLVVGCLTPGANSTWTLTNAASPIRTRVPDETNPEELKASAQRALGNQILRLANLDSLKPDSSKGQKVQVKGVLVRQSNTERINVLTLDSVATSCAP
jgi:mono/diheme cytochrome c family protein